MAQMTTVELAFCHQVVSLAQKVPTSEPVQRKYRSVATREFPRVLDEVEALRAKLERFEIALYLAVGIGAIFLVTLPFISIALVATTLN